MKKRIISMLLVLAMVLTILPAAVFAADPGSGLTKPASEAAVGSIPATEKSVPEGSTAQSGTLQFSTDLKPEYLTSQGNWSITRLTVAVGTYVPAGGTATELPAGTSVSYQWYSSTDDTVDDADTKVGTGPAYNASQKTIGITYYYVIATATIDGVTYTGTSTVACFKVGAPSVKVTLSVNNKGVLAADKNGNAMASTTITVMDVDCDGTLTYDEALLAAHSSLLTADGYATATTEYGLSVTKLWGVETTNTLFYLNGAALTVNVGETTVKAKDQLYASINQDDTYYSDKYTAFDQSTVSTTVGLDNTLTLTDEEGTPLAGMQVGTWEEGSFTALEGMTTDENGQVTLSFDKAGTYVITSTGTIHDTVTDYSKWPETSEVEYDCPIMAPACKITVYNRGELVCYGTVPSTTLDYKVGEHLGRVSGRLSAVYYRDGNVVTGVKKTTAWYRIGAGSGGVAQKVDNMYTLLTEEDIGAWKYYMYAECEYAGVKYTAISDFFSVNVSKATPIAGSSANGFVTNIVNPRDVDAISFSPEQTDYVLNNYDVGSTLFNVTALKGKGLWVEYRYNGIDTYRANQNSAVKVISDPQIDVAETMTAGQTTVITILVGTKYDSDGDGVVTYKDAFNQYDAYNFTLHTLPSLTSLSVKDSAGTVKLDKTVGQYGTLQGGKDICGETADDTITLSAGFNAGVKLYVGDSQEPYSGKQEIDLTAYRDDSGTANIPLRLVAEKADGTEAEHTVTLHLAKHVAADFDPPVIKTQPAAESSIAKDTTVTLRVEAEQPEEGTLSYQWYCNNFASNLENPDAKYAIAGATSDTYVAPADAEVGKYPKYYVCKVTLTIDGASTYTVSDPAEVTTELTYVNPPVISIQPGIAGAKDGTGVYRTEYMAGSAFDPMYMQMHDYEYSVRGDDGYTRYYAVTEIGCEPYTLECYYNTTPSTEGAIPISGKKVGCMSGGNTHYFSFTPDSGLPEGENYVFFVITSVAKDDPSKSASTVSDFVKLTYTAKDFGFAGSGTEEDPYLLKTGEDFVTIQQNVEEGINFSGIHFRMANDITLPDTWKAMGSNGASGLVFSGTLDGGGYQLNFAKGSEPLIHHAKGAVIKNLKIYGEEIQGCALIDSSWINQTPGAWIAKIDNVTLVSGTSTLSSGLVQGSASTYNPIYINNCKAEAGVIIGYDKSSSNIGTFAGGLVGTVKNCSSAATVYGVRNVGGLVGSQANSMAAGKFTNCSFTGTIVATGSNVGGIIGAGYNSNSAPNAMCVSIQNVYVNADITGKQNVGGLLGSNEGIDQCWENGIGYVRDNVFYGTLNGENNVGGLVGYYSSLNRYNIIENNYYYDTNGCATPIGAVEHIDTSAHDFGMGDDGIFYYDTSTDSLDDIKEFVDAEDKGTGDWQYTSVCKTNHNRTDDPMGADKEKLGKKCTVEEMADGTVLKLLNDSETSMKNWTQGEKFPVLDDKAVITSLAISGDYKDTYYIGEELDLTGAIFTAAWSDGSTSTIAAEDIRVEGFDSSERKLLTLVASYNGVSVEFQVRVVKRPVSTDITVYFTLYGDTIHGDPTEETGTHTWADQNLELWIEETAYSVDMNATVKDVFEKALTDYDMTWKNETGNYVTSITYNGDTLAEFSNGTNSGWMYTLNGAYPDLGVSEQFLEDGDVIIWHYTDDYTKEESAKQWKVMEMINALPAAEDLTLDDAAAVAAAREACNALTEAQQAAVSNLTVLEAAEARIAELQNQAAADAVIAQINALPAVDALTLDDAAAVAAAREAFDALTEAQQALVPADVLAHLTACEEALEKLNSTAADQAAADAVIAQINALPAVDALTLDDAAAVAAAQAAYDALTEAQQALVPADVLAHLTAAQARLNELANPQPTELPFTDVAEDVWYYDEVAYVYENGLMNGVSPTSFAPDENLSRAMFITTIYRLEGSPEITGSVSYTDVEAGRWYTKAVIWGTENGIINGHNNQFQPNADITREQMAAIMQRYAQYKQLDTSARADLSGFSDGASVSNWARENMQWAVGAALFNGNNHNELCPQDSATRAEAAAVLQRFAEKVLK